MRRPNCTAPTCNQRADATVIGLDVCALHALCLRIEAALAAGERLPRTLAERVCTRLAYGPDVLDWLVTGRKPVAA